MPSESKVYFFFEKRGFALNHRTRLKKYIESIFRTEKKRLGTINYIFCSDERLLEINRKFLHHDYYTDIITFELTTVPSIQAEVYISIDRVRDNARAIGATFRSELHRVMFHGSLHCCGYGDKTRKAEQEMRRAEDRHLRRYFA